MQLTLATRASRLALWQANHVKNLLLSQDPSLDIQFLILTTEGDRIQHRPLAEVGGKGLFIKALEIALLERKANFAVHSLKDVPPEIPEGLTLAAICEREDPRDVFISSKYGAFSELPLGAKIGTASIRRTAQLLGLRPDLEIVSLRGNIDTRLARLEAFDGIILAAAGLHRLGLAAQIKEYFSLDSLLPSVGQGALALECRKEDENLIALLKKLDHNTTRLCVENERTFVHKLQASCFSPVGVYAEVHSHELWIRGLVATKSGDLLLKEDIRGSIHSNLGLFLAERLLKKGADTILMRDWHDSNSKNFNYTS